MCENVEKCVKMCENVEKCGKMWKNVEKCEKMWKNVEKCGKMLKKVEKCGKMCWRPVFYILLTSNLSRFDILCGFRSSLQKCLATHHLKHSSS